MGHSENEENIPSGDPDSVEAVSQQAASAVAPAPRRFGLETARPLSSIPAMVLENDLASQLVVEESDVFDDPFYEALVATGEAQESAVPQQSEPHTKHAPLPPDNAPEAPTEAPASESTGKALLNTTASALVEEADDADDADDAPAAADATPNEPEPEAEPAPGTESEAKPEPDAEPESQPEAGNDAASAPIPEAEPQAQAEEEPAAASTQKVAAAPESEQADPDDTAKESDAAAESGDTRLVPTPKPQRKHGFRNWLKRLFHRS